MFLLGFLVGIGCAAWFILHADGDLLIRLGERVRVVARRYREWMDSQKNRPEDSP